MRKPLLISAGLHAAVLTATLVAFQFPRKLDPVPSRVLPVELLTIAEMTNLKRQAREIADNPKPVEKPKPEPTPEPPKPTPEPPKPVPAPEPEPEPEEKAELIPDKTAEKKPEEKKPEPPKPEKPKLAEKKPEKKKPKKPAFDPTNIKALLDKLPDKSAQKDVAKKSEEKANSSTTDDDDSPLTMSQMDALRQHINKCWNAGSFAGSADAATLYADIYFELNQDGSLNGPPKLVKSGGGSFSRAFADSAMRAIQSCVPYNFLPQDKYSSWKSVNMHFDLSGML